MTLFDALGFSWNRDSIPAADGRSKDLALFEYKHMLAEFVFDASVLERNPITFPEVQTLMSGVSIGNRKISDVQQVQNLANAAEALLVLVKGDEFDLNKPVFDKLHALVAKEEAIEWGHFRGEGSIFDITWPVSLGEAGHYLPPQTTRGGQNLLHIFEQGTLELKRDVFDARERAMAFFLFGALQQFYFDGNKRTSRFMMNGELLTNGYAPISVPAARALEFNESMVRFYVGKDATEMMQFLLSCQSERRIPTHRPEKEEPNK